MSHRRGRTFEIRGWMPSAAAVLFAALVAAGVGRAGAASGVQPPAQTPPPPPQPTFRTEANYVRVDAYPTRNGTPVADLTRDDFELLESGQPQAIEQFERIVIRSAGPQESRIEPNTVAESRSMLENPRARVFVLFLDTYHVDIAASHRIRKPLVDALDRVIGPDDLIGVMTPEMSPNDIAFARKTTTIDGFLARYWHWGERDRMNLIDPEDHLYGACFPDVPPTDRCADQNGIAAEMIDRRHEKRVIDALQDLVRHLRGVREERKAILAISNGWLLFRPNHALMRSLKCQGVPTGPQVQVDPRSGTFTTKDIPGQTGNGQCDVDRMHLAQIDDEREFREILDEANRANASFYPVDPRGLTAFDTPLMRMDVPGQPPPIVPPAVDRAMLTGRLNSLRTLADATDGLAIVDTNDLSGGLRRVVADLSAYYLIGYYSNGKLDGKFHPITVRVKRPGVQVRARRGYLAATPAEATRVSRDSAPPTAAALEAMAIESVLRPLTAFSRETSLRLRAAAGWKPDGAPQVWLVGEIGTADTWKAGAEADITLSREGETLATAKASVPPGSRSFKVLLAPSQKLEAGDYTVSVRTRALSMMATSSDMVPLPLAAAPEPIGSVIVRRGPFTGLKEVPTADLRFRRSEQMRVEVPMSGAGAPGGRLLDRTGKQMAVPIATAVREDGDGSRWITAQVPLIPLGPGDYIVEVSEGAGKTMTPFRIVP
jgi:VWFA-related protein